MLKVQLLVYTHNFCYVVNSARRQESRVVLTLPVLCRQDAGGWLQVVQDIMSAWHAWL